MNNETLAREFSRILRERLTGKEMAEVVSRNSTLEYANCCATHDFCDANMLMAEAFSNLGTPLDCVDFIEDQQLTDRWNAAWSMAKGADFYPPNTTWPEIRRELKRSIPGHMETIELLRAELADEDRAAVTERSAFARLGTQEALEFYVNRAITELNRP